MIKRPTVLVLGAGASMPFGFPSGEQLVSRILEVLEGPKPAEHPLQRALQVSEMYPKDVLAQALGVLEPEILIGNFHEALFYSGRQSIDTFLEHNRQFLTVGKMAIASVLVPLENERELFSAEPNWYKFLFTRLNARFEEFAENKLAILTYNYDRSLEQFLSTALRHSYEGMKDAYDQCQEQLSKIPIVHLHGSLGEFARGAPDTLGRMERMYEPQLTVRVLRVCADTIRVVSEDVGSQPQYQQAHDLLHSADVICFLGFGWDPTNLSRLQLNTADDWRPARTLYGTAYRKGAAERAWIKTYFGSDAEIELGYEGDDIDKFLRDFPVLFG